MRKHTINKLIILLILNLVLFSSCNKEKTCDVDAIVQRVFEGGNISIFDDFLNCKVGELSDFTIDIVCGTAYVGKNENPLTYLWFYTNEANYMQGMIIVLLHMYMEKKDENTFHTYYLKDYKYIPGFSENRIQYGNVSYGEPQIDEGGKHYQTDENIFGIYAYEGKYPPYYKEVKPKYLVYVENDKLVVEEPKDDRYFIYRIPEL